MSSVGDDAMDFGSDDDGDFLTGKLAALGIDEDLELSGGEEENDDPGAASKHNLGSPLSSSSPGRATVAKAEEETATSSAPSADGVVSRDEGRPQPLAAPTPKLLPCAGRGAIEDGELLELLEKPLQASRTHQQGSGPENVRHGRSRRRNGRSKGRSNNGKASGRNVTIKECATWVCERLKEPKYYLMCQVVATIGYNKSKRLLDRVQQIQDSGGMPTADGTRNRTAGGVFFTLLKEHMEPAKLKLLYADEVRVKKEKERAKRAANKRRAAAAEAGEDTMPPRNQPWRGRATAGRDMGKWVGPDDAVDLKRARTSRSSGGGERKSVATTVAALSRSGAHG